ncbi:MAG TPA: Clp protease N-terminal domain-containing protein [Microbacteriaceae bacterium]|nr:Clp protease N-terminal domain-containing protein [Microbacteriaceae bacterium]
MSESIPNPGISGSIRGVALAAIVEAQRQGLAVVEAEHILLALAGDRHTSTGRFLEEHGLDHSAWLAALRTERERSLQGVGVTMRDAKALSATRIQRPRWGASARTAFDRAQKIASRFRRGQHRLTGFDLLYGILGAELGTVPRALAFAGIDRKSLLDDVIEQAGMGDAATVIR